MPRLTLSSVAICAVAWAVAGPDVFAQADREPASLALIVPAREASEGSAVPITLELRNYQGRPVSAPRKVNVTVVSELLAAPARLAIEAGGRAASATLVFNRPGIAKLKATADGFPPAYGVIAVKARRNAREELDVFTGVMASAARRLIPRLLAAGPQPGTKPRLWLEILPPRISPRNGIWTGLVVVGLVDPAGQPQEADRDLPVRFAAEVGTVIPDHLVIPRGATTGTADLRIMSNRSGGDVVYALSPGLAGRAEHPVEYERPHPTRLLVTSTPAEAVSNGRTKVQIGVLLKDEDNHVVPNLGSDMRVVLGSSLGSLSTNVVTVARGRPDSEEVELSSTRSGQATIIAEADGLDRGQIVVRFALPWLFIALAGGGGITGAMLRSRRGRRRGGAMGDVAMGALLGMVFFALALFGVSGLIPAVPLRTLDNLTLNEIGAFLLGLLGGYLGRDYLTALLRPARASGGVAAVS